MSVDWLEQKLYPDRDKWDPSKRLVRTLERFVSPETAVLDLGAGAGELNAYDLKGRVKEIVGVDLDPRVAENPLLDRGIVADIAELPLEDNSFDVAFSIYVLEHVADPAALARELQRVLKPGGVFLSLTPSKFHYVPIIASLTPMSFHKWVNRNRGRDDDDTFPTCYRLNSRRDLKRHFVSAGFDLVEFDAFEVKPNYLKFNSVTFLAGAVYERVVNSTTLFDPLRCNFVSVLRKRGGDSPSGEASSTEKNTAELS
ncbi:MAG: class I SAM-dependent methyltransferase [Planctomycetota bacterium]